jgi:hypothetical protein
MNTPHIGPAKLEIVGAVLTAQPEPIVWNSRAQWAITVRGRNAKTMVIHWHQSYFSYTDSIKVKLGREPRFTRKQPAPSAEQFNIHMAGECRTAEEYPDMADFMADFEYIGDAKQVREGIHVWNALQQQARDIRALFRNAAEYNEFKSHEENK